eukprot:scaffold1928_cov381-Prasinococcus_capsulatus_cf.AAC.23
MTSAQVVESADTYEDAGRALRRQIHSKWRGILRLAKVEELRREVEVLSQNHEHEMDRKEATVQVRRGDEPRPWSMLNRDLADAEEQHRLALRSHLTVVDGLLDTQQERMRGLSASYRLRLERVGNEFASEGQKLGKGHQRHKEDALQLLGAMEQTFSTGEAHARRAFENKCEEISNQSCEEYNIFKVSLESSIEELQAKLRNAHSAYLARTSTKSHSYAELSERDEASARLIEEQGRELSRLQESMAYWKTKAAANAKDWTDQNALLREEREAVARHYQELKGRMSHFRDAQHERTRLLAVCSGHTINVRPLPELERQLAIAQQVLKLAELNAKLETEHEKAAAFAYTNNLENEAQDEGESTVEEIRPGDMVGSQECNEAALADGQSGVHSDPIEEHQYLGGFLQRLNKANPCPWGGFPPARAGQVVLDEAAITAENQRLERENGEYRALLKKYVHEVSVSADVLRNPLNPLLVVNQKYQAGHVWWWVNSRPRAERRERDSEKGAAAGVRAQCGYKPRSLAWAGGASARTGQLGIEVPDKLAPRLWVGAWVYSLGGHCETSLRGTCAPKEVHPRGVSSAARKAGSPRRGVSDP